MARSSACGGRAEGHLAAVQAEHEVEAARALHVVARHEQRAALVAQLGEQRRRSAARWPGRRPRAARRAAAPARPARAPARAARAGAGRPTARRTRTPACSARPDALERRAGGGALAAPRRQPPAPVGERAHQRHVERAHAGSRAACARSGPRRPGGRRARTVPAAGASSPEQRAEQRGLAAAVGAEHADGLARAGARRRPRAARAPPAVAGRERLGRATAGARLRSQRPRAPAERQHGVDQRAEHGHGRAGREVEPVGGVEPGHALAERQQRGRPRAAPGSCRATSRAAAPGST